MENSIFGYVSSIALFSYLFMLLVFINTERNKVVNAFIIMLTSLILWTGGSLLMRYFAWPNYVVWYHVSLGGLLLMTLSYFQFITAFLNAPRTLMYRVYSLLLFACFVVNIPSGLLLHWPSVVVSEGKAVLIYDKITPWVALLFGLTAIIMIHMFAIVFSRTRRNRKLNKQFTPIVLGILILFAGNLAIMSPVFKGFPLDIAAGILNAILLMYALIRNQLFKVKITASNAVGHLISITIGFAIFFSTLPYIEQFMIQQLNLSPSYHMVFRLVVFTGIVYFLMFCWHQLLTYTFVREEVQQNEVLKDFSNSAAKTLELNDIFNGMVSTITEATGVNQIYIGAVDHLTKNFHIRYSAKPLLDVSFSFKTDNPLVEHMRTQDDLLSLDDFKHTAQYKSMWDEEKKQLERLSVSWCFGLKEDGLLIGIVLFSDQIKKVRLKPQDFDFIVSVCSVASIAMKNAHAYEKALIEARTDELTGVLNRRHFYELIQGEYEKHKEGTLALILISLDDFKLFNQLYGVKQGDLALIRIAQMITASIGSNGFVARYSGKEFAVILPNYDVYGAKNLCESIQKQISRIGKEKTDGQYKIEGQHKAITISAGISICPYGATSVKELISNVEQAVFHVKRMGKNGIRVFDTFVKNDIDYDNNKHYSEVYDEYKSTIYALTAAIDAKDHYTFNHSQNVAKYACALAGALNLNHDIIENIRQAALLHDIGKIAITEIVLNKPGRLTQSEYLVMQGHVEASIDIIRHLPSLDYVIPAVLGHHERYDGTGYPRRIAGEDIPLTARILCIADAFDAMISERCYKPGFSMARAIEILEEEAGKQFDPELVPVFVTLVKDRLYEESEEPKRVEHVG